MVSLLCTLGVLAGSAGVAAARRPDRRPMPPSNGVVTRLPVSVGPTSCAPNWLAPGPGSTRLVVTSTAGRRATLRLRRAGGGKAIVTVTVPAHGHRSQRFSIRPGSYQFDCRLSSGIVLLSSIAHVGLDPLPGTPHPALGPGATGAVFRPVIRQYRHDAVAQLAVVASDVTALRIRIGAGSATGAESAWITASLDWERLGGTYGSLGTVGTRIDEIPDSLPGGDTDPRFVGLHKIEIDLWQRHDLEAAGGAASQLASLIARLRQQFPTDPITAESIPTRTHEILEDGLRDVLSGDDDFGSGIQLPVIEADVEATDQLIGLEAPLLVNRAPGLASRARQQLGRVDTVIDRLKTTDAPDGSHWPPLADLSLGERESVDAVVGRALTILSRFPVALRPGGSGGDAT